MQFREGVKTVPLRKKEIFHIYSEGSEVNEGYFLYMIHVKCRFMVIIRRFINQEPEQNTLIQGDQLTWLCCSGRKWLVQCMLLYTCTLDKSLSTRYQKNTAMLNWSPLYFRVEALDPVSTSFTLHFPEENHKVWVNCAKSFMQCKKLCKIMKAIHQVKQNNYSNASSSAK